MKSLLVVAMLMAPVAANASTGPETPSVAAQLRCTWLTLQQAARGDFSQWVLPDFVPGRHLHAGDLPECLRADGPVRPAPSSHSPALRRTPDGKRP